MERAKKIIIFFIIISFIIFAINHGIAWFKNGNWDSFSTLISILKIDLPFSQ